MKYLKYNDKIPPNSEYFDGFNWVKTPKWMVGEYVSKLSGDKKRFRVKK